MNFTGIFKLSVPILALALPLGSASAAVVATSPVVWNDGSTGGVPSAEVAFDVANASSILVATIYVDTTSPGVTNVRFGDGTGIGSGDVAPDATTSNGRLQSFLFINPDTASGLSFSLDNTGAGIAAILYEVSGANTSLSSITTALGSTTINTTIADEFIISFAGYNGNGTGTVTGGSIFADVDIATNQSTYPINGGGGIGSASSTAPAIGSNDITWSAGNDGRIAYAFETAAVPEPSSLALLSIFGLGLIMRRRRA